MRFQHSFWILGDSSEMIHNQFNLASLLAVPCHILICGGNLFKVEATLIFHIQIFRNFWYSHANREYQWNTSGKYNMCKTYEHNFMLYEIAGFPLNWTASFFWYFNMVNFNIFLRIYSKLQMCSYMEFYFAV